MSQTENKQTFSEKQAQERVMRELHARRKRNAGKHLNHMLSHMQTALQYAGDAILYLDSQELEEVGYAMGTIQAQYEKLDRDFKNHLSLYRMNKDATVSNSDEID